MSECTIKQQVFEEIRLIIYGAIVLSGILSCILPFCYICDLEGVSCAFCGMRHAIDYVLQLDFVSAYYSNRYIVVVIMVGFVMVADCFVMMLRKHVRKNKNNP